LVVSRESLSLVNAFSRYRSDILSIFYRSTWRAGAQNSLSPLIA
jgi:hypothetical protein